MALSYDEVDALADYAQEHGVTFPLLSDPDHEIIERFGILNTLVEVDDHPWYGIPFPGTYVVDGDGTITAKFFENNLFLRASSDQLLRSALGEEIELEPLPERPTEVLVDVAVGDDPVGVGVLHDLIVRFAVPEGLHLYGDPVPDGMVATSVDFDEDEGLVVRPAEFPATTEHTLAGTGEVLHIFEGDVTIRVPITHNGRSLQWRDDGSTFVTVAGTVRWQACDDDVCHLPQAHRFELELPARPINMFERERPEDSERMDFHKHFAKMSERRAT